MTTLIVDGANVVGSKPDGWWRDRPGAAARLHTRLLAADLPYAEVVLVLEGRARAGVPEGRQGLVRTVHAPADGDGTIADLTETATDSVTVVTADRGLAARVTAAGGQVIGPGQLLADLSEPG